MVGPEVSSNMSGTVLGIGIRVRVNLVTTVYQKEVTYLPSSHVIVALNSSMDSGLSWAGALEMIKASNVPAFFTDQSELVCANAKPGVEDGWFAYQFASNSQSFQIASEEQCPI